jgi:hypothetical protein
MHVYAKTVILGIPVEESSPLEQHVGRCFNAGDHRAGTKGSLFHIPMIVVRILIEDQPSQVMHWKIT